MGKKVRTKKACEILGCCPDTLRRWTEEGKLTAYRASEKGNRRWDEDELRAYLGEIKPDQTTTASKGNLTLYVDPKYDDVLLYLKHTIGITAFIEGALDKVVIDPDKFNMIQQLHKTPNG